MFGGLSRGKLVDRIFRYQTPYSPPGKDFEVYAGERAGGWGRSLALREGTGFDPTAHSTADVLNVLSRIGLRDRFESRLRDEEIAAKLDDAADFMLRAANRYAKSEKKDAALTQDVSGVVRGSLLLPELFAQVTADPEQIAHLGTVVTDAIEIATRLLLIEDVDSGAWGQHIATRGEEAHVLSTYTAAWALDRLLRASLGEGGYPELARLADLCSEISWRLEGGRNALAHMQDHAINSDASVAFRLVDICFTVLAFSHCRCATQNENGNRNCACLKSAMDGAKWIEENSDSWLGHYKVVDTTRDSPRDPNVPTVALAPLAIVCAYESANIDPSNALKAHLNEALAYLSSVQQDFSIEGKDNHYIPGWQISDSSDFAYVGGMRTVLSLQRRLDLVGWSGVDASLVPAPVTADDRIRGRVERLDELEYRFFPVDASGELRPGHALVELSKAESTVLELLMAAAEEDRKFRLDDAGPSVTTLKRAGKKIASQLFAAGIIDSDEMSHVFKGTPGRGYRMYWKAA